MLDSSTAVEIDFRLEDKYRDADFELGLVTTPVVAVAKTDEILAEVNAAADNNVEVLLLSVLGAILDVFICAVLFFIVLLDNMLVFVIILNFTFSIDKTDTGAND